MGTLVIETATAACSVALLSPEPAVLASRHEIVGRGHAERLIPMIGELMEDMGAARADAVLVDCGPGSFTGIRVGLAAARALGLAWGVDVSGYSALAALAGTARGAPACAVALTGGHGEIFVQRFALAPLRPLDELRSLTPEAAAATVPEALVIGSGAVLLVRARGWGEADDRLPAAADVTMLPPALVGLPPRPIYGRAPDAVASR